MMHQIIGQFEPRSPLSCYERQIIETRLRGKWRIRKIGRYLNRSPGIISREIRRNIHPSGKYLAEYAQSLADKRSHTTNKRKMDKDPELCRYVKKQFEEDLPPEQIAGRLKKHPPDDLRGKNISHESIYQYIYNSPYGAYLYNYLRHKTAPRRQKQHSRKRQKSFIPERISIHDRPKIIDDRERFGDWKSDSVNFSKLAKSITFDNGGEGAKHTEIRDEYGIDTYFCDPYKSWQKGGVENSNGLIRQYLPRETNLDNITEDMIYKIQERLNNRPRKKLGHRTPNEVINSYILNQRSVALNS